MSESRSGYQEVDVLLDVDGLCAVITKRNSNSQYSYAIMKVFERDGEAERTSFVQRRHQPAVARLNDRACERIDELVDQDKAMKRGAYAPCPTPRDAASASGAKR